MKNVASKNYEHVHIEKTRYRTNIMFLDII
jgi:hypothetical protein